METAATETDLDGPVANGASVASQTSGDTIADLQRQVIFWRGKALRGWAEEATHDRQARRARQAQNDELIEARRSASEALAALAEIRKSTSWRVTAPLRVVTGVLRSTRARRP